LGDQEEPEGSILVCTITHSHAMDDVLAFVQENSILDDFGDSVGLRIPGIDPKRQVDPGIDFAVDQLIVWEDLMRERVTLAHIEWTRG
jgi:hypothetical protein